MTMHSDIASVWDWPKTSGQRWTDSGFRYKYWRPRGGKKSYKWES